MKNNIKYTAKIFIEKIFTAKICTVRVCTARIIAKIICTAVSMIIVALSNCNYLYAGDFQQDSVLTLEKCRVLALKYNKDLSSASRQASAADYTFKSYRANFFPNISASATAIYSTADGNLSIPGGNLPTFSMDATGKPMPNGGFAYFPGLNLDYKVESMALAGVNLEQPIYMGGKVRAAYKLAKIGRDVAMLNENLVASDIIVKTEEAYVNLVKAQEMKEVAVKYNNLLKELFDNVQKANQHGLKPKNDILKVQVKLNESELAVRRAENANRLAMMNLCHYIGMPLTNKIVVSSQLPAVGNEEVIRDITQRDEYSMVNNQVMAMNQKLKIARSEMLPQLGLKGMYSYLYGFKINNNKLFDGFAGTVLLNLTVPIFHFGAQYNKVRAAKEELVKAEDDRQSKNDLMMLELTKSINELDEARLERDIADRSFEQAEENLSLSRSQYEVGLETLSDHLEAQALWQKAYATRVDAYFQLYIKNLAYLKAAGLLHRGSN